MVVTKRIIANHVQKKGFGDRIFHCQFKKLVKAPIDTVKEITEKFNYPWTEVSCCVFVLVLLFIPSQTHIHVSRPHNITHALQWRKQEFAANAQTWLDENPAGKHGKHSYNLEMFGLTEGDVREAFAEYYAKYIDNA